VNIPNALIGGLMLVFGRKLFWLFVGCIGFAAGINYAEQFLGKQPDLIVMAIAVLLGVFFAVSAIFFERAAVGLAGFLAGGFISLYFVDMAGFSETHFIWLVCLGGGILGTALLTFIFDWALIFISSLMGAMLLMPIISVQVEPRFVQWAFVGLVITGAAVQAKMMTMSAGKVNRKR
jgi:hypothetical protein